MTYRQFLLLVLLATFVPWLLGGVMVGGFRITGWSWLIAMLASAGVLISPKNRPTFSLGLWVPWLAVLLGSYLLLPQGPAALQSLAQMACPIFVGMATSTFRPNRIEQAKLLRWLDQCAWIIGALVLLKIPMLLTGRLPEVTGLASESITALLFAAIYAAFHALGSTRHLIYYLAMTLVPLIAMTRGPLGAVALVLPLSPLRYPLHRRIAITAAIAGASLFVFYLPRVQAKMFYSGQGDLSDLRWDNHNFQTSGRSAMWEVLWDGIPENPWFGHGINQSRFALNGAGFELYLPHNDWLKLLYDVGWLGAGLYGFSIIVQVFSLLRLAHSAYPEKVVGDTREFPGDRPISGILAAASAAGFVPYVLIMLTDNVILYAQFYGNLHFTLIGLAYGTRQAEIFESVG